jgi:hypothetical protein
MYDESPKLYYITVLVGMGLFVGLILGIIWTWNMQENKTTWIVAWVIGGGIAFLGISNWFITRRERWAFYEWETTNTLPATQSEPTATGRYLDLQLWTDKTTSNWIRLGVTDEQWRTMAIAAHNAQAFSTDVIERTIYGKLKQRFVETGIIVQKGSGYELTRAGKNLVKLLATLPYPYEDVPELVRQLDGNPTTPLHTRENA